MQVFLAGVFALPWGAGRGCSFWWLHQEPARAWKCLKGKEPNQIQSELVEACGKEHGWSETALRSIEPIRTGAEQEISQVLGMFSSCTAIKPGSRILHHWDSPGVGQEFSTRNTSE